MRENTDHPTQKPAKLVAKLVLASSNPGDVVLDPFLGVGTTSDVAKKLGRAYVGIAARANRICCLAEKRLAVADAECAIQGYRESALSGNETRSPTRDAWLPIPKEALAGSGYRPMRNG